MDRIAGGAAPSGPVTPGPRCPASAGAEVAAHAGAAQLAVQLGDQVIQVGSVFAAGVGLVAAGQQVGALPGSEPNVVQLPGNCAKLDLPGSCINT